MGDHQLNYGVEQSLQYNRPEQIEPVVEFLLPFLGFATSFLEQIQSMAEVQFDIVLGNVASTVLRSKYLMPHHPSHHKQYFQSSVLGRLTLCYLLIRVLSSISASIVIKVFLMTLR